jgi:hypothetical protein
MKKLMVIVLATVLLVCSLAGHVTAQKRTDSKSAQTGYISVDYHAFFPTDSDIEYEHSSGGAYITSAGDGLMLVAPIQLPHGATITSFTAYYHDTSEGNIDGTLGGEIMIELRSTGLGLTSGHFMAVVNSQGSSGKGEATDSTINYATIDNSTSSYYIMVSMLNTGASWESNRLRVAGATVEYQLP